MSGTGASFEFCLWQYVKMGEVLEDAEDIRHKAELLYRVMLAVS